MEMESLADKPNRHFNETSTRFADAADRATNKIHDVDEKTRNAAHDIKDLNREYFEDIDFNAIDLLKIPSVITSLGLVLTAIAANDLKSARGLFLLAAGFICDNADGLAAKVFNQESDAGALYDVVADKIKILITLLAAWYQDAVPRSALTAIGVTEISHIGLTGVTKIRHKKASIRPPRVAKAAMASRNTAVAAHLVSEYLLDNNPESKAGKYLKRAKLGLTALSICLEIPTLKKYVNRTQMDGIIDND